MGDSQGHDPCISAAHVLALPAARGCAHLGEPVTSRPAPGDVSKPPWLQQATAHGLPLPRGVLLFITPWVLHLQIGPVLFLQAHSIRLPFIPCQPSSMQLGALPPDSPAAASLPFPQSCHFRGQGAMLPSSSPTSYKDLLPLSHRLFCCEKLPHAWCFPGAGAWAVHGHGGNAATARWGKRRFAAQSTEQGWEAGVPQVPYVWATTPARGCCQH